MQKILSIVLLASMLFLLPGCYDYTEPDEKAWVLAIGLDKGQQNELTVTLVIAVPKGIGGGEMGPVGEKTYFSVSMETPTLLSSLELVNALVDREADLSHIKWFIFSRELAEEGIAHLAAPLVRFQQFRRNTGILVCEERAEDFLSKSGSMLDVNIGKTFELALRTSEFTEFVPFDNFHQFYLKSKSPGVSSIVPLAAIEHKKQDYPDDSPKPKGAYHAGKIPRQGGREEEIMGAAVFVEDHMVGILDGDETGVQKMLEGTFRRTIISVLDPKHPGHYIIVEIRPRQKAVIDIQLVDGYPRVSARLLLEGDVISIQGGEPYDTLELLPEMEAIIEKDLQATVNKTIAKSQDLRSDIFGFGLHAKKKFTTWPEWEAYRWDDKYPLADISVKVDYKMRRVGLIRDMQPLQ